MDFIIFVLTTLTAVIAASYLFGLGQVSYIKKNWVELRCNPLYMPMAGMVGDDIATNFTKCTLKGFNDYAGVIMDPLMAEFDLVNDTLSEVTDTMGNMQSMMGGVRGGFIGIIGGVFGKIHNLMSQFEYTIIRMRTLLARVMGVMITFVNVFYTGGQTAESVVNGPIIKTMSFLCFDEKTLVTKSNLTTVPISKLSIGDKLLDNAEVTSIYYLLGDHVQMYMLNGVKVSGSHKVKYKNKFIRVDKHPLARITDPSKILYCLNTSNHRINVRRMEFLDFVESEDQTLVNFKRQYVEEAYNGTLDIRNKTFSGKTGVFPYTMVPLTKNIIKPIFAVLPGDILDNGDKVLGVVVHQNTNRLTSTVENSILMSPYTWILKDGKVSPAFRNEKFIFEDSGRKEIFQLITETSSYHILSNNFDRIAILDEMEIIDEYYDKLKDSIIASGRFRGKIVGV